MFLKQDSNFVLQANLTDSVVTSEMVLSVTYSDNTDKQYSDVIVATNGTTAVTLLEEPSNGVVNLIELIKIYNPDTQANTVQILAGTTVIYTCTVGANQSLVLSDSGISNSLGFTPLAVDGDGRYLTNINPLHVKGSLGTKVAAYNTSSQLVSAGTSTKLIMPSTWANARNEWNTAESSWTMTDSGTYILNVSLNFSSATPCTKTLTIYKNGTPWIEHKLYCSNMIYSWVISEVAGSVITFYIKSETAMTLNEISSVQLYSLAG